MSANIAITERFENGYVNIRVMAGVFWEGNVIEDVPGFRRRILHSEPHQIILLERWAANRYGTTLSEMIAFRGGGKSRIPEVSQPVEILMNLRTWEITQRFYPVFDQIREQGVWMSLSPTWWRLCDVRLNAKQPAPPLDQDYLARCASPRSLTPA
jgi:hypothetical protein